MSGTVKLVSMSEIAGASLLEMVKVVWLHKIARVSLPAIVRGAPASEFRQKLN